MLGQGACPIQRDLEGEQVASIHADALALQLQHAVELGKVVHLAQDIQFTPPRLVTQRA